MSSIFLSLTGPIVPLSSNVKVCTMMTKRIVALTALLFAPGGVLTIDLLVTAQPHPFLYRNTGKKGRYRFEEVTDADRAA